MRRRLQALALFRIELDRWAVVYLVVSGFYPLLRPDVVARPYERLVWHLGAALFVWFLPPLARMSRSALVRFLGEVYLPFAFPLFYAEMEYLGIVFHGFHDSFDPVLIGWEERIFGLQPSLAWSRAWPWAWFHELMEMAYFSYYALAPLVLAMIVRDGGLPADRRWPAIRAFARDLGGVMLLCYTLYTFFPAWGPKYFRTGPIPVEGWIFTDVMRYIHANGAILGAAFPSSHVAASMVAWWHVWRLFPRHRWWMSTLFALLCAATVYCRYHYVVDVIGGLMLGALVIWAGEHLNETGRRLPWRSWRPPAPSRPRWTRR